MSMRQVERCFSRKDPRFAVEHCNMDNGHVFRLGCFGTVVQNTDQGRQLHVLVLTTS